MNLRGQHVSVAAKLGACVYTPMNGRQPLLSVDTRPRLSPILK